MTRHAWVFRGDLPDVLDGGVLRPMTLTEVLLGWAWDEPLRVA